MVMRYVVGIVLLSSAVTHAVVQHVTTSAQFDGILKNNNVVVVKFGAEWCGPCRQSKPRFEALSNQFSSVPFVEIDVDKVSSVADRYGISSIPAFIVFKNGNPERVTGSDWAATISGKLSRIVNLPVTTSRVEKVVVERPLNAAGDVVAATAEGAGNVVRTAGEGAAEVVETTGEGIRGFFNSLFGW